MNFTHFKPFKYLIFVFGGIGLAYFGYAIYFDYKRQKAINYKNSIRLKRKLRPQFRIAQNTNQLPFDYTEMQSYFLQEVQLGEDNLMNGFEQEGIDHFANAIILCNKQEQVMEIFRLTLREEHYLLLTKALPDARKRFARLLSFSNHTILQ